MGHLDLNMMREMVMRQEIVGKDKMTLVVVEQKSQASIGVRIIGRVVEGRKKTIEVKIEIDLRDVVMMHQRKRRKR